MCNGTLSLRLRCRERSNIRAERLEEPIWSEVKRVIQNPDLIVAGIDTLDSQEGGGLVEETAQAERDLRSIQMEEDRAIRLFVSGKITETQLDHQRRFITERLESARAKLDDYRAQEASGAEKRRLMEAVLAWAREVGQGLDELTPEQRREILQMIVEQIVIDRDNNVDITLAIPIDEDSPESELRLNQILVWKFSRFTRKREHAVAFKSMLRRKGVRVVSITEHADDTPTGKLLEGIIESVDEFYSENLIPVVQSKQTHPSAQPA